MKTFPFQHHHPPPSSIALGYTDHFLIDSIPSMVSSWDSELMLCAIATQCCQQPSLQQYITFHSFVVRWMGSIVRRFSHSRELSSGATQSYNFSLSASSVCFSPVASRSRSTVLHGRPLWSTADDICLALQWSVVNVRFTGNNRMIFWYLRFTPCPSVASLFALCVFVGFPNKSVPVLSYQQIDLSVGLAGWADWSEFVVFFVVASVCAAVAIVVDTHK